MNNINPNGTRLLGWYALRWTHITDWFKANTSRRLPAINRSKTFPRPFQESLAEPDVNQGESLDEAAKEEQKLKDVVNESHSILATAKSVFPFTPFPDLITIDRHKLTIVYRSFFGVEQTVSVPIENIKNVQADIGPFFGSLTITSDHFINNTQTVHYLRRGDVKKIQKLVQGATVALKEKVNINKIETKDLTRLLSELGEGHTDTFKT